MKLISDMFDSDTELVAAIAHRMLTAYPEKLVELGFPANTFSELFSCSQELIACPFLDEDSPVDNADILKLLLIVQASLSRSGLNMAEEMRRAGQWIYDEELAELQELVNEVIAGETIGR